MTTVTLSLATATTVESTWTVPERVYTLTSVTVYAAGGSGGTASGTPMGAGGGAGGGVSIKNDIAVVPGQVIAYGLGGPGGTGPVCQVGSGTDNGSYFADRTTFYALRGTYGTTNDINGAVALGSGGGDVCYGGGNGGTGVSASYSGGGGSAAGTSANGNAASGQTGGTSPGSPSGAGRNGLASSGSPTAAPNWGGGGGGGYRSSGPTRTGGVGGATAILVEFTPHQMLSPTSDISSGAWTPSTGATLYGVLDEPIADDADYIYTGTASTSEVKFSPAADPRVSDAHVVRYRAKGGGTLTTHLVQGTTVIATDVQTLTGTLQTFSFTLSGAEADAITDYSDLRLRFVSS